MTHRNVGMSTIKGQEVRPVIREARTPSWYKTCCTCGETFHQMMHILFMLHENGSQYVCVGWQCFDCEKADRQKEKDHADAQAKQWREQSEMARARSHDDSQLHGD